MTHAYGSREGRMFSGICLSVCLFVCPFACLFVFFPHDISKTDEDRITKLDVDMVHHESWKLIYFGVRMSGIRCTKTLPAWVVALL